ncbi:MAG: NAD(P)/FAD-dependent oxidoreductase, partial [Actinobacteria bacterium]
MPRARRTGTRRVPHRASAGDVPDAASAGAAAPRIEPVAQLKGARPPGEYPVVVIGSGPGGLQTAYSLGRLGVETAVISTDDGPGGMFRRFPLFQRLITWTKIHAPAERGTRPYEWYDWNSLIGEDPTVRALVPQFMDGSSYFPARHEMERGLTEFRDRADVAVRYGCRWESTRMEGERFVVTTSDGEYMCRALVIAVGMTEPWKPANIPGIDLAPHYVDTMTVADYAGKRVLIVGKRNSGFEVADALLPWARQIVLASPRPARISVLVRSTAA